MTRLARPGIALAVGAMSLLSAPLWRAPAAGAAPAMTAGTIAVEFMWAIDIERTSRGLGALVPDPTVCAQAQTWSGGMALFGTLVHDRSYQTELAAMDPHWQALGENVGYGPSPQSVEAAFMASPEHRANILGNYTHMGVGVFVDGTGRVWVTERFYR
jgi:uncharacterized protein YkwD